jgi:uncharacterized protein
MRTAFDWDPAKAASNLVKHRVSFDEAIAVFRDPLALSRLDERHGANEERWVTLGQGGNGRLIVVVHTYAETDEASVSIRIISARRPTKREARQYEEES